MHDTRAILRMLRVDPALVGGTVYPVHHGATYIRASSIAPTASSLDVLTAHPFFIGPTALERDPSLLVSYLHVWAHSGGGPSVVAFYAPTAPNNPFPGPRILQDTIDVSVAPGLRAGGTLITTVATPGLYWGVFHTGTVASLVQYGIDHGVPVLGRSTGANWHQQVAAGIAHPRTYNGVVPTTFPTSNCVAAVVPLVLLLGQPQMTLY